MKRSVAIYLYAIAVVLLPAAAGFSQTTKQEHVHHMSPTVMPFEMQKTLHVFRMTEHGGIERVVIRRPEWKDQVPFIQQHLQHEARKFQQGDYSDPAKLHGAAMPGLKELQDGASRIEVSYAALPDGAEIRFKTPDLHLLTAIHRWFGAQLSEHGADAMAE